VLVLYRKEDIIRQLSLSSHHDAASLRSLFELFRNDDTVESSKESTEIRKNALRLIIDKAIQAISSDPEYRSLSYGVERERSLADFGSIFKTVADFCYNIEHGDLVRQALEGIVQDTKWTSSSELVRVVAYQVARDSVGNCNETWNSWYFVVKPPAFDLALTDHRLTRSPPISTFKYVNDMRLAFELIQSYLNSNIPAFEEWKTIRLRELLHAVKSYDQSDVPALMQLVRIANPETYYEM
jgi:hypothetical protein